MALQYIYNTAIQIYVHRIRILPCNTYIYSDTIDTSYGVTIHKYMGINVQVMNVYMHIRKRIYMYK